MPDGGRKKRKGGCTYGSGVAGAARRRHKASPAAAPAKKSHSRKSKSRSRKSKSHSRKSRHSRK